MDSIIETQRACHEEIERYEEALALVLLQDSSVQYNKTLRDRKAADILQRIGELRHSLALMYEDAPGLRPVELALLSAQAPAEGDSEDKQLAEFYSRFDKIKDFHQKNTNINARELINTIDGIVNDDGIRRYTVPDEDGNNIPFTENVLDDVFSGPEAYGRNLDLYDAHSKYLNLKGTSFLSYIGYIEMLKTGRVERALNLQERSDAAYLEYVQSLYTYLVSFFERALPLVDLKTKLEEDEAAFEKAWAAGEIKGWGEPSSSKLSGNGIWCPYCAKHYSKQTVYDAHLNGPKHKKKEATGVKVPEGGSTPAAGPSSSQEKLKKAARYTFLSIQLLALPPIPDRLTDSRNEVERKAALTDKERQEELEDVDEHLPQLVDLSAANDEDEDDDTRVYNPLKLPLGWDGKPIPYWLYKLHGLGVEFKCEICSGYTYMGRKAFDRHFQESRHAFGMRALGLPNTKHFHEITKIQEALALAEKLKTEGREELQAMEKAEEFEDEDGNVYDRRTYEDLRKQGLL